MGNGNVVDYGNNGQDEAVGGDSDGCDDEDKEGDCDGAGVNDNIGDDCNNDGDHDENDGIGEWRG